MIIDYAIFGVIVGFLSSLLGIGGGMFLVPLSIYLGFSFKYAVGISIMQMMFSSFFVTCINMKNSSFEFKYAKFISLGGILGALLSGVLVNILPSYVLSIVFIISVSLAAIKFFITPVSSSIPEVKNKKLLFLVGFIMASISFSVGIGGGALLTPILVSFFRYDIKKAVATSLLFITTSSIVSFISISYYGYVNYSHGFLLGIFSIVGVLIGVRVSKITSPVVLKYLLLLLMLMSPCYTVYKVFLT